MCLDLVNDFDADMFGTDIFSPLQAVFNADKEKNYIKKIFLLTDGEIYDTKEVLDVIKKHCTLDRQKQLFTFGVGNDCD